MSGQVVNKNGFVEVNGVEIKLEGVIYEEDVDCSAYTNSRFGCKLYIPEYAKGRNNLGLIVTHDGLNKAEAYAMDCLVKTGEAPPSVMLGIDGGVFYSTVEGGHFRYLRANAYDVNIPTLADWVVDEVLPYFAAKYGFDISASPDMHMVTGGSSGGLSAWTFAWERNDFFRRVYMSSPSFLAMAKGSEHVVNIRKYEPKPIRVFADASETEPDNFFGSSLNVADGAVRALKYSGYDFEYRYYPGEGHCSRAADPKNAVERMRFLWKNWESQPITVKNLSPIAESVILLGEEWRETDMPMPGKCGALSTGEFTPAGEYAAEGTTIVFTDANGEGRVVAEGFEDLTSLAISSDKWRLYAADKGRGCAYTFPILDDGSLGKKVIHGPLQFKTDFTYPGIYDMCTDSEDRIYAATEIGIQVIRPGGFVDLILENPCGRVSADKVALSDDGYLYAQSGGKVYRRKLNNKKPADMDEITTPIHLGY